MNYSRCFFAVPLAGVILMSGGAAVKAGTVTAPGIGVNQTEWRTPTVVKPFDGDNNNVYGSAGYFLPRFTSDTSGAPPFTTSNGVNGTLNTLPAFFSVGVPASATAANTTFGAKLPIDDPNNVAGPNVASGIAFHSGGVPAGFGTFINFTINSGVPAGATLRVGILSDTSGAGDVPNGFTLAQTTGTGTSSATYTGLGTDSRADWYFFDIANPLVGDVYTLSISANAAGVQPTIGGVSLDIVPEPSTWALLFVGLGGVLGLALRQRRLA